MNRLIDWALASDSGVRVAALLFGGVFVGVVVGFCVVALVK